jgi:flagellar hook-associated protein FlgK
MPGLFDGIRVGLTGILTHRKLVEMTGNNIANASNENYSRQEAHLETVGSINHQGNFFGEGVDVAEIVRIRDDLLEKQVRDTSATAKGFEVQLKWLQNVEALFNEPSDYGLNASLSDFWESWSDLSTDPENFAARSNVITKTENLSYLMRDLSANFATYREDINKELEGYVGQINVLSEQVAELNDRIFLLEAGRTAEANDLRDQRDAALKSLGEMIEIRTEECPNGMVNVFVDMHPLVFQNNAEGLKLKIDTFDAQKKNIVWEDGDSSFDITKGEVAGLIYIRDTLIPSYQSDLDDFASTIISEANKIYSNGASLSGFTAVESNLGIDSLGVSNTTTSLELVEEDLYGSMHISFHDTDGKLIRSHGILVDNDDSLDDIVQKLDGITGLAAFTVSDVSHTGRLRLELDTISGENSLGEASFTISNNVGEYDSSMFLNLLEFDQTDKSTNASAAAPELTSRDLTELQTVLEEANIADVMSKELNLSGTFTINAFETMTESTGNTDGFHVQQLVINVESTDSINSIMTKINSHTANYGVAITLNGSNQLELTSTAQTDTEGNVVLAGGTDYLRLSFANTYQHPSVDGDEPPQLYTTVGDDTDLLATMQLNTLFEGSTAADIALDRRIDSADKVNAGYEFKEGNNSMSLDMAALQHLHVALNDQFTVNEYYQNIISGVGSQVQEMESMAANEEIVLQNFLDARDQISGVNLDEELANMIIYQRAYEANARMIATFDEMIQELLR